MLKYLVKYIDIFQLQTRKLNLNRSWKCWFWIIYENQVGRIEKKNTIFVDYNYNNDKQKNFSNLRKFMCGVCYGKNRVEI